MRKWFLIIITYALACNSAFAMLRTLKYRQFTKVRNQEICVYAKHEHNLKKANRFDELNTKAPIVCKLHISGLAKNSARKKSSAVFQKNITQHYDYEKLTKSCVTFDLPKNLRIKDFVGLTTECTTAEAAVRVFPEYAAKLKSAKSKIAKMRG